jgi:hypothetical protein
MEIVCEQDHELILLQLFLSTVLSAVLVTFALLIAVTVLVTFALLIAVSVLIAIATLVSVWIPGARLLRVWRILV